MSTTFFALILFGVPVVLLAHEVGHLLAARWFEIRVCSLSIGLGPKVFGFTDQHGTRWLLSAIPLGGYLKLDDQCDQICATKSYTFSNKSLPKRAAVYAAGPLANLLMAVAIYSLSFAILGEGALFPTKEINNPASVFASLLSGLSIFVAVFSLIPMLPLDGGNLALVGFEAITGKSVSDQNQKRLRILGMATIVITTVASLFWIASRVMSG